MAFLLEKFKQYPNDPESKSVETGMQTHSICMKNKNNDVHNSYNYWNFYNANNSHIQSLYNQSIILYQQYQSE